MLNYNVYFSWQRIFELENFSVRELVLENFMAKIGLEEYPNPFGLIPLRFVVVVTS